MTLLLVIAAIVAASSASAHLGSSWFRTSPTGPSNVADADADASGTNVGLVWSSGGGPRGGVYGSDMSGLNTRLITAFPRLRDKYGWDGYLDPTWSRTGRRLAYVTWASGTILVHGFTKATRRGITFPAPAGQALDPAWAPDEDRLAYHNFPSLNPLEGGGYISIVSVTSGRSRILIAPQPKRRDRYPAWSPNGKTIAFTRQYLVNDGRFSHKLTPPVIYLVNASGGSARRLTAGDQPDWSADGTRIVFAGKDGVYVIGANGSGRTRLVPIPPAAADQLHPQWSPDGKTIMYVDSTGVWTMDAEGGHRTPIYKTRGGGFEVDWDPDWH